MTRRLDSKMKIVGRRRIRVHTRTMCFLVKAGMGSQAFGKQL